MTPAECIRLARVRGRVQGVFFRASTAEQARRLGLRGYARNLADGSVEVLAAGATEAVEQLLAWLRHGPPMAQVEELSVEALEPTQVALPGGFGTD